MENKIFQSVYLENKKAHKKPIISIDVNKFIPSQNLLATSSDDQTIRIWDLRLNSSVKLIKCEQFKNKQLCNAIFGDEFSLLVGASNNVYKFDLKTEQILIDQYIVESYHDSDEINQIQLDPLQKYLACCDDSGNTTVLDPISLQSKCFLGQQHTNISYSVDFIHKLDKQKTPVCVTSGFDCQIIFWDIEKKFPFKCLNIAEVAKKYIQGNLMCPPLIYSVTGQKSEVLVSTETGHIFCMHLKQPNKPKYIISAHLGKILKSTYAQFNNERILSISNDKTFAIWDTTQRDIYGSPIQVRRVQIQDKPNWIESSLNNQIFVADQQPDLHIYTLKE